MQVENLTFGGGKGAAAQGLSMQRITKDSCRGWLEPSDKSGSGCGNSGSGIDMTICDYSKRVFTETSPHNIFGKQGIDMDTDLILISSPSLNTTLATRKASKSLCSA